MSVPIEDRYRIVFDHHRFVSQYRLSLVKGWATVYAALSAVFLWSQSSAPHASWAVAAIAVVATILFWAADARHRPAIGVLKDVATAIEEDPNADIPEKQRYFSNLNKGISHSLLIDIVAILTIVLLSLGTAYLIHSGGRLPGQASAQQSLGGDSSKAADGLTGAPQG